MNKGEFLLKVMEEKGYKMKQLAEESGVPYTTIRSMIERDLKKAAIENVIAVCKVLGISVDKLSELASNATPDNVIELTGGTIRIPIIGTIACGDPITADQNVVGYLSENSEGLPGGTLFALEAKGNSMEPTIPNGAFVSIREQSEVENGEIAAVLVNGDTEATLKRVKRQGGLLILMPDNSQHEPYIVTPENPAKIMGKAVRFSRNL